MNRRQFILAMIAAAAIPAKCLASLRRQSVAAAPIEVQAMALCRLEELEARLVIARLRVPRVELEADPQCPSEHALRDAVNDWRLATGLTRLDDWEAGDWKARLRVYEWWRVNRSFPRSWQIFRLDAAPAKYVHHLDPSDFEYFFMKWQAGLRIPSDLV